MKRAFIIHGWGGWPGEGWFPWLKQELEKRGFIVAVPAMPHPDEPTIDDWVSQVARSVGTPDADTYLIGHSVGCQTIMRYLESIPGAVGGVVFVGGFFTAVTLESQAEEQIGRPWLTLPIDLAKVRQACRHITVILSDNDPIVPLEPNRKFFSKDLSAKVVVEHEKGHFSGSDGITELPSALQAVLNMSTT